MAASDQTDWKSYTLAKQLIAAGPLAIFRGVATLLYVFPRV